MSGHVNQNLGAIRKKFPLSGVSSEEKDLPKFVEDTDSHIFGEELEDSLKKVKGRHYSLLALKEPQVKKLRAEIARLQYQYNNMYSWKSAGQTCTGSGDSLGESSLLAKHSRGSHNLCGW